MKRTILCFLLMSILIFGPGCSYAAYVDYYTDTAAYSEIWDLPGMLREPLSDQTLFPCSIHELDVLTYFCRYDQQFPLGEGIQVFLKIRYDDDFSFLAEKKRIESVSYDCDAYFDTEEYSWHAVSLAESDFFEYAAVSRNKPIICYVYLQSLPIGEIEIDQRLIPRGYPDYGELNP